MKGKESIIDDMIRHFIVTPNVLNHEWVLICF